MNDKKLHVAGVGEVLWDIYDSEKYLGGAVFNYVHHIKQLGEIGYIVSRIGADERGLELENVLKDGGYLLDFLQIDDKLPTGYVRVTLDENKIPTFNPCESAAYFNMKLDEKFIAYAKNLDAILYGTFTQKSLDTLELTEKYIESAVNAIKVFDVNIRWKGEGLLPIIEKFMHHCDIFKMNEDEFEYIKSNIYTPEMETEECMNRIIKDYNISLCCLTLGDKGCWIADRDEMIYSPSYKIDAIDTTGAGDAFVAGLTCAYLKKSSLKQMGEFANLTAAYTAAAKGACPQYSLAVLYKFKEGLLFDNPSGTI